MEPRHLPIEVRNPQDQPFKSAGGIGFDAAGDGGRSKLSVADVRKALVETGGNKVQAAKLLGVGRATLYRFLEKNAI